MRFSVTGYLRLFRGLARFTSLVFRIRFRIGMWWLEDYEEHSTLFRILGPVENGAVGAVLNPNSALGEDVFRHD